jgi:hypothetical protein
MAGKFSGAETCSFNLQLKAKGARGKGWAPPTSLPWQMKVF